MKKPKFKLLKEFKDFISRGNVLDLAVGMIIGSAFTAIITAVVSNILQPLINWIPLNDKTGSLITELKAAVIDEATGAVLHEAIVINWGAVISAIITFLLTALVLFTIIKIINSAKSGAAKVKEAVEKDIKKDIADDEAVTEDAAAEAVAEVAAPVAEVNASEELLREIRDLLKAQAASDKTTE